MELREDLDGIVAVAIGWVEEYKTPCSLALADEAEDHSQALLYSFLVFLLNCVVLLPKEQIEFNVVIVVA